MTADEKFYLVRSKFGRNFKKIKKPCNFENFGGMRSCSTSYPSGNLVDGSPLVAIITRRAGAHASKIFKISRFFENFKISTKFRTFEKACTR